MPKKLTIKDHIQEIRLFNGRAIAASIFVLIFALIIIARLFYLQIIEGRFYKTLSEQNIINLTPITPKRGLIYDRNGILLAKNVPVFSLSLIPGRVKNLNNTLKELQKILNISPQELSLFQHNLHQYHRFTPIPLIAKISEEQAAKFYVNQYRFKGVFIEPHLLREYPLSSTFSNVIGYVARITRDDLQKLDRDIYQPSGYIGKTGIEKQYENTLRGNPGNEEVEINARGEVVRHLKKIAPNSGQDLYLTIDSRLQIFAEKALGQDSGVLIALDPNTGEILAMVSQPSFDPNLFVMGISNEDYQALLKAPNHPLYNRAIRGLYSPGSTIKPFYAIGGLDAGIIDEKTTIVDHGEFRVPNTQHVFHDWKLSGHGLVNVTKALAVSCDIFFYNLAQNLGIYRMDQILLRFGFGALTGIDFPGELSGVVPSPEWKRQVKGLPWYTGDAINAGIGQGTLLVTPMQLAVATAALANQGLRLKPHLLLKKDPSGLDPIILNHQNIWQIVAQGMQEVLAPYGTAAAVGQHLAYTVAAKTGTAQVFGNRTRSEEKSELNIPEPLRNNHLFIAYAPVDHPKIVLVVIVEHNNRANQIARNFLDYYFSLEKTI